MMQRVIGRLAAISWLALAGVTAAGMVLSGTSAIALNTTFVAVFAAVAAFLYWRARIVEAVARRHPDSAEVAALLRIETIAAIGALLTGLLCVSGAIFRVWREGMALFG